MVDCSLEVGVVRGVDLGGWDIVGWEDVGCGDLDRVASGRKQDGGVGVADEDVSRIMEAWVA